MNKKKAVDSFEKKWLQHFASDISAKDIKEKVVNAGGYIWHVFSWELISADKYLTGDDARRAYDSVDKTGAQYVVPFGSRKGLEMNLEYPSAEQLDKNTEVYAVSADWSWTYIKTHEGDYCGPYFYMPDCRRK